MSSPLHHSPRSQSPSSSSSSSHTPAPAAPLFCILRFSHPPPSLLSCLASASTALQSSGSKESFTRGQATGYGTRSPPLRGPRTPRGCTTESTVIADALSLNWCSLDNHARARLHCRKSKQAGSHNRALISAGNTLWKQRQDRIPVLVRMPLAHSPLHDSALWVGVPRLPCRSTALYSLWDTWCLHQHADGMDRHATMVRTTGVGVISTANLFTMVDYKKVCTIYTGASE